MLATLINFTGSTTDIIGAVGGIFSSFSSVIALLVAIPLVIWILNVLKNWALDAYYDQKDDKA